MARKPVARKPGSWRVQDQREVKGRTGWYGVFITAEGKQRGKTCETKKAAESWASGEAAKVITGTHIDDSTTLGDWSQRWLAGYNARPGTVAAARCHIGRFAPLADKQLKEIKPSDIRVWVAGMEAGGLKPSTIYQTWKRLRTVLSDAVHDELLRKNPALTKDAPKSGKPKDLTFTDAQVWEIHTAMPAVMANAVLLGRYAGARISEAAGMRWSDVDIEGGKITFAVQFGGADLKTDDSAGDVYVASEVLAMLVESESEYVCGDLDSPRDIEHAFAAASEGIEGTFHTLRHTFGSQMIADRVDIVTVARQMRHANPKITLGIYAHKLPTADDQAKAAAAAAWSPPKLKAV